ncbi:MAG: hypothetical protein A2Z04_00765 [Chloroflexi bacterium RBG_16_57_9]|nr:MAG: hypothetical protein A2Z04_00765 [Chloroflexi bacterium RBG_16_57_9]
MGITGIGAVVFKSLGPPPFWSGPQDFISTLAAVYAAVTLKAEECAFGESGDNQVDISHSESIDPPMCVLPPSVSDGIIETSLVTLHVS